MLLGAQRLGLAKGEQRYMTINIRALNNGTYFLLIQQNGTTTTQRVMVAH